eukprot:10076975-Heterocapsa_arctica.AAC.1
MEGSCASRGEGGRQGTEEPAVPEPAPCHADRQGCGVFAPAQPHATPVYEEGMLGPVEEGGLIEPECPVKAQEVPEVTVTFPLIPRLRQQGLRGKAKALGLQ